MSALQKYKNEKIRLTADGKWLHGDAEITHERTLDLFFKSIQYEKGRYFLAGEKKPVFIEVEDVAFFVRRLDRPSQLDYQITLSDGSREALDPQTLDVGPENRLYCRIKDGIKARFDRKAYYDLMKDLTEESGFYGLKRGGLFYPIQRKEDHSAEKATPIKTAKKVAKVKTKSIKSKPAKKAVKKTVSKSVKKSPKKKPR